MNLKKMHDEVLRLSDPMRLARKMADSFEPGDTPGTLKLPKMTPLVQTSGRAKTDRELLIECFERILADWKQIDGEWGPTEGGLEGAIARGEETLIPKIRKHLAEPPSA